jgi:uncharacterized membrane protein
VRDLVRTTTANLRRDRILFYAGILLLLLGGVGFLVGTLAHDTVRVPLVGTAYDAFGWVNQTFLALGIVFLVVGVVLLLLALRGGVLSEAEIAELREGESGT